MPNDQSVVEHGWREPRGGGGGVGPERKIVEKEHFDLKGHSLLEVVQAVGGYGMFLAVEEAT